MSLLQKNKPAAAWFVLGHEPLLSAAEIFSVLRIQSCDFNPPVLRVGVQNFEPLQLIRQLGGTVKIGEELSKDLSEKTLLETMMRELETVDGKINFGISVYGSADLDATSTIERWGKEIKKQLREQGRSVRYVFKDEPTLSSVTVEKNGLAGKGREFLVTPSPIVGGTKGEGFFSLAKTVAIQPFEQFSARDYNRPGRDARSGMLPPKLALMMLNLATDHLSPDIRHSTFSILDPFCGSGTILTEAMLLGFKSLIGTDISEKAIADTKQNIEWQQKNYSLLPTDYSLKLFQTDVTSLGAKLPPGSVNAIVTEPYLGPPLKGKEPIDQIKKNALELNHLYFQSFKEFKKILRPGGIVVFLFPRFQIKGQWVTISNRVVPDIEKLGFTIEPLLPKEIRREPFVLYHRADQLVGREIWRFSV